MNFMKYPSLHRVDNEKSLYNIRSMDQLNSWVALEKIHGSNFAIYYDGAHFKQASRNQFVDGTFCKCAPVVEEHKNSIKEVFNRLSAISPDLKYIIVYGEIYGGIYNGYKATNASIVQHGINYRPDNGFLMFDIYTVSEERSNFIGYPLLRHISNQYGLPMPKELGSGTLEEMLQLNNTFQSYVAPDLGLEALEDNTAEGLTIRPTVDFVCSRGSRAMFKNVCDTYYEKARTKLARKGVFKHPKQAEALPYICTNRLNNVLSKIGALEDLSMKDFGKILGDMTKDVLNALIEDGVLPNNYKKQEDLKNFGKWVAKETQLFVKKELSHKL